MTPSACLSRAPSAVTGDRESGSAVADFAMVSGLLSLMFLAVFQLGLAPVSYTHLTLPTTERV